LGETLVPNYILDVSPKMTCTSEILVGKTFLVVLRENGGFKPTV